MEVIPVLIQSIEDGASSKKDGVHFTTDFASALLANILHAPYTHKHLKQNPKLLELILVRLLNLVEKH